MNQEHVSGGRVAIITGASSGIGEATARCMARAGFFVVLVARRGDLLRELEEQIRRDGGGAMSVVADLADAQQTHDVVTRALERTGTVDVLVNNAGYGPPGPLEYMDRDALRHAFEVNFLCGAQLISELTPVMRKSGGGRVINVSSAITSVAAPFASVYAATKGAMEAMTDCLRLELAPWNIQLSLIIPGFVHTPTFEKSKLAAQSLTEDLRNPYRERMFAVERFADTQLARTGIPAEAVGDVIVRAATDRQPKARYHMPLSAHVAMKLFAELPDALTDRILSKIYQ